ncbi:hypothetical protein CKAN_02602800 [Cinnamomum micranthum f. kanehirae]|uniref:Glycosyltransferase subfamily 4-like N-terminal domain-containing protein n=1 Tax=Cinnamomum micranthum f. kanehirae TaxID=337451 RepID=A0A3S3NJX9_9MAGN|nr:hypothetical protein CKAN_02602800 [Cinnamomum micranthum f. kanehirae]
MISRLEIFVSFPLFADGLRNLLHCEDRARTREGREDFENGKGWCGGAERLIVDAATALASHGHNVHVFTAGKLQTFFTTPLWGPPQNII